jgi:hypothetical protein
MSLYPMAAGILRCFQQAQEQRLFASDDGEALDFTTFESFQDANARWKSWSRIETTKRYGPQ